MQFRIVSPRNPCRAAAMQIQIAWPTGGTELAGTWNGPEPPGQIASLSVICGNKASDAVISSGSSNNDFVVHDQGRTGGAVVAIPIGISDIPNQVSGAGIQTKQMRVVGHPINAIVPNTHAAAKMARGIVNQSFGDWSSIVPYSSSSL